MFQLALQNNFRFLITSCTLAFSSLEPKAEATKVLDIYTNCATRSAGLSLTSPTQTGSSVGSWYTARLLGLSPPVASNVRDGFSSIAWMPHPCWASRPPTDPVLWNWKGLPTPPKACETSPLPSLSFSMGILVIWPERTSTTNS